MIRKLAVLDLETTIHNTIGNNKASPHSPANRVVYTGLRENSTNRIHPSFYGCWDLEMLIGHNIKFDLLYLMRKKGSREWMKTGKIWDTQLAEYILTGQQHQWASLDDLSKKYGGTLKDDRLKEFWNNGISTEDIDPTIVIPYLENDLENTEIVAVAQMQEAYDRGLLPLINSQMDALLATTEMEYNGLTFDTHGALTELNYLNIEFNRLKAQLLSYMEAELPETSIPNIESKDQLSAVLFGGTVPTKVTIELENPDGTPLLYKTGAKKGKVKTRKVSVLQKVNGLGIVPKNEWATKKAGVFKTDEEVLKELSNCKNKPVAEFTELLLKYRTLSKEINTYYKPLINLVFPDGKIHGNLNHCATATGRLSSTNPNLQNITNKED